MRKHERQDGGHRSEGRSDGEETGAQPGRQELTLLPGGVDAGQADEGLDAQLRAALSPMLNEPVPENFLRIIAPLKKR